MCYSNMGMRINISFKKELGLQGAFRSKMITVDMCQVELEETVINAPVHFHCLVVCTMTFWM